MIISAAAALTALSALLLIGAGRTEAQAADEAGQGAPAHGMTDPAGPGMMGQQSMMEQGGSMARHHRFMMGGVPEPYASMRNPLPGSPEVIARGRTIFAANCASCHGPEGRGDGEAGRQLSPRPGDLAKLTRRSMMSGNAYLYWTIAQGGAPFGTAMPAFEDVLSRDEIWSVVRLLQAGLPPAAEE